MKGESLMKKFLPSLLVSICLILGVGLGGCTLLPQFQLTVTANNAAYGTVTGAGTYIRGTVASISATPNEGYEFVNWTIGTDLYSLQPTTTVNMNANTAVVANFRELPPEEIPFIGWYVLAVDFEGKPVVSTDEEYMYMYFHGDGTLTMFTGWVCGETGFLMTDQHEGVYTVEEDKLTLTMERTPNVEIEFEIAEGRIINAGTDIDEWEYLAESPFMDFVVGWYKTTIDFNGDAVLSTDEDYNYFYFDAEGAGVLYNSMQFPIISELAFTYTINGSWVIVRFNMFPSLATNFNILEGKITGTQGDLSEYELVSEAPFIEFVPGWYENTVSVSGSVITDPTVYVYFDADGTGLVYGYSNDDEPLELTYTLSANVITIIVFTKEVEMVNDKEVVTIVPVTYRLKIVEGKIVGVGGDLSEFEHIDYNPFD
jgi:hypothetical protein